MNKNLTNSARQYGFMLFLVIAETGMFTFWRNSLGVYWSPVITALLSLLIVFIPSFFKAEIQEMGIKSNSNSLMRLTGWAIFICGILVIAFKLNIVLEKIYINAKYSDIIPAIDIYVSRFMAGMQVYTTFTEFEAYTIEPNYLPLQWLPFTISKLLGIDHRWLAFFFFAIGAFFYQTLVFSKSNHIAEVVIKSVLPHCILLLFISCEPQVFGMTIEPLIAGYYLILFFSMMSPSPLVKGIGVLVCLLSRFSLVLWLPLYFFVLLRNDAGKALRIGVVVAVGVLFIYVLPFLSQDWHSFSRGLQNYTTAGLGEWHLHSGQQPGEKPVTLFRGVGFAAYFYDFAKGELMQKYQLLKIFHLLFALISVLMAGIYYLKKPPKDHKLFLLLSLKFYFIFFYSFIQQPYVYLQLVPVFLSVFIFSQLNFSPRTVNPS